MKMKEAKKKPMKKRSGTKKFPSMDISNKNVVSGKRKRKKSAKAKSYQVPALSKTVPKKLGAGAQVKRTA